MLADAVMRVYPSGFLGAVNVKSTQPQDIERQRGRLFYHGAVSDLEPRSGSLEASQLWDLYGNGDPCIRSLAFQERVIRHALEVFGTQYLYDWIQAQYKSPNYDQWHQRWIDETLQFVYRSRVRDLSSANWVGLLGAAGQDVSARDSTVVDSVFFNRERLSPSTTIEAFIHAWLQQPGGIDDLTSSLHVLFGGR